METKFRILELKRKPDTGFVIGLTYAIRTEHEDQIERKIGNLKLEEDSESSDFIPFEQLTEETVIDWVKSKVGEEEISKIETELKERIEKKLVKKANPEFLTGKPW
jgi:monomeric isocitrate dehydrogenase